MSIHGNGRNNTLEGGDGSDVLYGDDGDDELEGNGGIDILDGGKGRDLVYYGSSIRNLNIDLGSETGWKYNRATGTWEEGYEYILATYDYAYDNLSGGEILKREYDYLKDIEDILMYSSFYTGSENRFISDDGVNNFWLYDVNNYVDVGGGDDVIITGGPS